MDYQTTSVLILSKMKNEERPIKERLYEVCLGPLLTFETFEITGETSRLGKELAQLIMVYQLPLAEKTIIDMLESISDDQVEDLADSIIRFAEQLVD